jgi:hypothetical protein
VELSKIVVSTCNSLINPQVIVKIDTPILDAMLLHNIPPNGQCS